VAFDLHLSGAKETNMSKADELLSKAVGKVKAAAALLQGDTGIFRRLKDEHAQVNVIMKRIESTAADAESERRSELVPILFAELLSHAHAEQRVFYSMLRDEDETRDLIEDSGDDHMEIENLLYALVCADLSGEAWKPIFRELQETVLAHVDQEEHVLMPLARNLLNDKQARMLEAAFVDAKKAELRNIRQGSGATPEAGAPDSHLPMHH
jgi:hemerythrin superfamily protein